MKGNVLIKVIFSVALMVMGMMAGATPVGQRDTMARKTDGREVVLLKKGDMMPNYVFKDVNGKRVSLKSFRGKYVISIFGQRGAVHAWSRRLISKSWRISSITRRSCS